jgi:starch-binding outer membrane protein, SusD/RagB family
MKKYITIVLLLVFFSCDTIFHEEDNEYIVIDKKQEKVDLLNGVYSLLAKVHDENYFTALSRSDDVNIYSHVTQDDDGSCSSYGEDDIDYSEITGTIYKRLYSAIVTINSMIAQLSVTDETELAGELYFLRGYCYFKLARLFGTPPLITDTEVDYLVEKPTYTEVYNFIEEDLLNALDLLPDTYTSARIPGETPHKGTAKALLAEIYLAWAGFPLNNQSKYAEAAKYSGEVIQQSNYYNFELLDDFENLWKIENKHNKETVWGLFFNSDDDKTKNTMNLIYKTGSSQYLYGENGSIYITRLLGTYKPELKFFNTFPNNYRKWNSLITGYYNITSYSILDSTISSLVFNAYNPLENPCELMNSAIYLKWVDISVNNVVTPNSLEKGMEITLYLLRYAQTLLTYAEASARAGKLDESAFEAVNKVRRRANKLDPDVPSKFDMAPTLTTQQFLDSVVWERAWELSLEPEGRWFDIVRLNLKDKLSEYQYATDQPNEVSSDLLSDDWYFYLIPQEDRWVNPNYTDE